MVPPMPVVPATPVGPPVPAPPPPVLLSPGEPEPQATSHDDDTHTQMDRREIRRSNSDFGSFMDISVRSELTLA
jgi:hypothetical protein